MPLIFDGDKIVYERPLHALFRKYCERSAKVERPIGCHPVVLSHRMISSI